MMRVDKIIEESGITLDSTLSEVVISFPTSIRLQNCIAKHNPRPFNTVREYLSAGEAAYFDFMKLRGVGKSCAEELDSIVINIGSYFNHEHKAHNVINYSYINDHSNIIENLSDYEKSPVYSKSFKILLGSRDLSVRLRNVIQEHINDDDFPFNTIGDYIRLRDKSALILSKYRNLGDKSINELDRIICSLVTNPDGLRLFEESIQPIEIILSDFLSTISLKEKYIITSHYGLLGEQLLSLRKIGLNLSITPAQVIKIEEKVILELKKTYYFYSMILYLEKSQSNIFSLLSDEKGIILKKEINNKHLSNEHLFAIKLSHGSVRQWLSKISKETKIAWNNSAGITIYDKIKEVKDLFEKAEKEIIISEKSNLFTKAILYLDIYADDYEFQKLAEALKEAHIKVFLSQLSDLSIDNIGDAIHIMDMIYSAGDLLVDLLETNLYKKAAEKIIHISKNIIAFAVYLSERRIQS